MIVNINYEYMTYGPDLVEYPGGPDYVECPPNFTSTPPGPLYLISRR